MVSTVRIHGTRIVYCLRDEKSRDVSLSDDDREFLKRVDKMDTSRLGQNIFGETADQAIGRLLTAVFKAGLEEGKKHK